MRAALLQAFGITLFVVTAVGAFTVLALTAFLYGVYSIISLAMGKTDPFCYGLAAVVGLFGQRKPKTNQMAQVIDLRSKREQREFKKVA